MSLNLSALPPTPHYASLGTAAKAVVLPRSGHLKSFGALNLGSSARYLLLFDAASESGITGTPFRTYPVYPSDGLTIIDQSFWGTDGLFFEAGIAWAASSSPLVVVAVDPSTFVLEMTIS
jgi:hypothetical protein